MPGEEPPTYSSTALSDATPQSPWSGPSEAGECPFCGRVRSLERVEAACGSNILLRARPQAEHADGKIHDSLVAPQEKDISIILFFQMRELGSERWRGSFQNSGAKQGLEFRHWDGCSFCWLGCIVSLAK